MNVRERLIQVMSPELGEPRNHLERRGELKPAMTLRDVISVVARHIEALEDRVQALEKQLNR